MPRRGPVSALGPGGQYARDHDQRALAAEGVARSTSEVGRCGDNAPVESFFGRLKCELGAEGFATRDQARAVLLEYREGLDNRVRRHSALGFLSPAEFERAYRQTRR